MIGISKIKMTDGVEVVLNFCLYSSNLFNKMFPGDDGNSDDVAFTVERLISMCYCAYKANCFMNDLPELYKLKDFWKAADEDAQQFASALKDFAEANKKHPSIPEPVKKKRASKSR